MLLLLLLSLPAVLVRIIPILGSICYVQNACFTCSQKLRMSTERFPFSPEPEAVQQASTWTRVLVVAHANAKDPTGGNGMHCAARKRHRAVSFIHFRSNKGVPL